MAFKAPAVAASSNKNFVKQPDLDNGAYPARLWSIVTLGLQKQRPYQGEEKAPVQEIYLTYELQDEYMVDEDGNELDDKPRVVGEKIPFYPPEKDKSKCAQRYSAFDKNNVNEGDWSMNIAQPCMVNINVVTKGDKTYTNVTSLAPMRDKDVKKCHDLINPQVMFDFHDPDKETWDRLPQFIQNICKESLEFEGSALQEMLNGKVQESAKPQKAAPAAKQEDEGDDDDWS